MGPVGKVVVMDTLIAIYSHLFLYTQAKKPVQTGRNSQGCCMECIKFYGMMGITGEGFIFAKSIQTHLIKHTYTITYYKPGPFAQNFACYAIIRYTC